MCVLCGTDMFIRLRYTFKMVICVFLCALLLFIDSTRGFNLEVEFPDVRTGTPGSMFGFSVAQHVDQGEGWLLVGSPTAATQQAGIIRGGAVYRCRANNTADNCSMIPFDQRGNSNQFNGSVYLAIEDKSHQWFGATVASSGNDGHILACAPLYVYKSPKADKRAPVGTCYLSRYNSFTEFTPCKSSNLGYDKGGYCEAGFSAAFSNNGERLLLGAPGAFYWQGQVHNIYLDRGNAKKETVEETQASDDSYRGYSSAVGRFDADDEDDYVVGVPRAEFLLGKVELWTQNMSSIRNISGEQIGAYFGYAVAVEDLDGNKLDDIIVGAPFYSDYSSTKSYDTGRVYIYYQNKQRQFRPKRRTRYDILDGHSPKSRFGSALIGLKDLNIDGFKDLAVGAPYGGRENRGAVYIYLGSERGIVTKVSQVIEGADLKPNIATFGWSLSGGLDLDKNRYTDLLVGAYSSNNAVYLKARPIVYVAASLKIDPKKISLDRKVCNYKGPTSNQKVTCVTLFTCIKYDGIGVPRQLTFDLSWKFDVDKKTLDAKRLYQLNTNQVVEYVNNKRLSKNKAWCQNSFVYIRNDIRDKLTPINVQFEFKLKKRSLARRRRSLQPILDQYTPTLVNTTGHIQKECGEDEECIPDVWGTAYTFTDNVKLGSTSNIDIVVHLENRGEGAFETMLYIELPRGVQYNGIQDRKFTIPFSCDRYTTNETNLVTCDMGNPLPTRAKANFTLRVTPGDIDGNMDRLSFKFVINSSNAELNSTYSDNTFWVTIPVIQAADIIIIGRLGANQTEQIVYNDTGVAAFKHSIYGPPVVHEYDVRNLGPSDIKESMIDIYWPSFDDVGRNLLYLTHTPEVIGQQNSLCETIVITPFNSSLVVWYGEFNKEGQKMDVVMAKHQAEAHRKRRSLDAQTGSRVSRDSTNKIVCNKNWCTIIRCKLGYMRPQDSAVVRIQSRIWTDTLVKSGLTSEPYLITSQAVAEVRKMPYSIRVANQTYNVATYEIGSYVNAKKLAPQPKAVEPWIIAVAVSAGLLLLLLLIVLLWWCGFFRRKRREHAETYAAKPLIKNGANNPKYDINSKQYE
ncbi:integrin alpha-V-like isoform X2 [Ylistrum balloti]|uniref:integrin alpha-V-like isoform X2 n=1 Tax=Ylistrum balloti TaxID=509963 RepID=UPI0029058653|nr:integrin alpha-V-like isoform X2 [Ylistrum balloti]